MSLSKLKKGRIHLKTFIFSHILVMKIPLSLLHLRFARAFSLVLSLSPPQGKLCKGKRRHTKSSIGGRVFKAVGTISETRNVWIGQKQLESTHFGHVFKLAVPAIPPSSGDEQIFQICLHIDSNRSLKQDFWLAKSSWSLMSTRFNGTGSGRSECVLDVLFFSIQILFKFLVLHMPIFHQYLRSKG